MRKCGPGGHLSGHKLRIQLNLVRCFRSISGQTSGPYGCTSNCSACLRRHAILYSRQALLALIKPLNAIKLYSKDYPRNKLIIRRVNCRYGVVLCSMCLSVSFSPAPLCVGMWICSVFSGALGSFLLSRHLQLLLFVNAVINELLEKNVAFCVL